MARETWTDGLLGALRCPVCAAGLGRSGGALRCAAGHSFDIARQGYVNLLAGTRTAHTNTADTAEMVADRAAFLAAGHYAPLAEVVADLAGTRPGLVAETGAGTGYHLAAALDRRPDTAGLALDVSPAALRRAARAHHRLAAVVWDVWRPWPMRDHVVDVLLDVFAPRNGPEFHRVLRPDGLLVVVTPGPDHLAELGTAAGLLTVDPAKPARLAGTLDRFERISTERLRYPMTLDPADVARVVGMGPAGHHQRPAVDAGTDREVTASFVVAVYRPSRLP